MVQTHQYNTAEADVFPPLFPFFSRFCFSPRFPIRSCGSLQAFMPATNGVTARLTNMQSVRVEKEKKIQPLSHPASYHKGTFNKPVKKSK